MLKNIISGMCVGIANIIPGVSGGTILVILGMFDKIMEAITKIFSLKTSFNEKLKNAIFILQITIGIGIGLVGFAKILEFLFNKFPNQTLYWFIGLIIFSIPLLKEKEMKKNKISLIYFALGAIIVITLSYFSPVKQEMTISLNELLSKTLNLKYITILILLGIISGATMIFPGVSGSMVLLVLGYYHLFKGYVANVTSFEPKILIPLLFIAIGVFLGIVISSFITNYLLKRYKNNTMSFIFGLIIASALVIIPTTGYTPVIIITSLISFLFGGLVITLVERKK